MNAAAQWLAVTPAAHVQERRQRLGLTQVELAGLAGVATKTVQNIEQGRPASRSIYKVIEALDRAESGRSALGIESGLPDRLTVTVKNGDGYEVSVEVERGRVGDVDMQALAHALAEAHRATFRTGERDGTTSGGHGGGRQVPERERPVSW